jgi:hypothetical protein
MTRFLFPVFLVVTGLAAFGCSESTPPKTPVDCSSVADTTQPATVSFANNIVPLFLPDKYNCLEAGCHGGGLASSNYSLASYEEVLKAGDEAKQLDMCAVKPGDPDASYLLWKVEGRAGILMQRMPLGCVSSPDPNDCVSASDVALVRAWILEGARNN